MQNLNNNCKLATLKNIKYYLAINENTNRLIDVKAIYKNNLYYWLRETNKMVPSTYSIEEFDFHKRSYILCNYTQACLHLKKLKEEACIKSLLIEGRNEHNEDRMDW